MRQSPKNQEYKGVGKMSGSETVSTQRGGWTWLLILGIVYVILGLAAMAHPYAVTLAIDLVLGFILLFGGVVAVVSSFFSGSLKKFIFIFISGLLYLIVGGLLLKNPFAGVLTLTIILAAFLVVEGFFKIVNAFQLRPQANWFWLLISGVASLILGVMIWGEFPASGRFVLGLLLGVYMLINGVSMIMVSLAFRDMSQQAA